MQNGGKKKDAQITHMALGEGLQQVKSLSWVDVKIALCLNDIQDAKRRPEA